MPKILDAPWPFQSIKLAAKRLGVDREVIEGLAKSKRIESFERPGVTGIPITFVRRSDIDELVARVIASDADRRGGRTRPETPRRLSV